MLKFALCDDESYMLDRLESALTKYAEAKGLELQITRFPSGSALLESDTPFDLIFLDIQMEAPDGMETARQLRARGYSGLLVFTTVLAEAVYDSFEVRPFDYLVKPLDESRLGKTMDRAIHTLEEAESKSLMVRKGGECLVVPFSQILYCEVIGRKIYLHRQEGEVLDYYEKMENLVSQLDGRFFRCHRSYLVNLDHVSGYGDGTVRLSIGTRVPVSRLREGELGQALLSHMRGR